MSSQLPYPYSKAGEAYELDGGRGWRLIPPHMHDAVRAYVEAGVPPGKFLRAVLQNQLVEAIYFGDRDNRAAIEGWAMFAHNYLPVDCWGSRTAVEAWIARGGFNRSRVIENDQHTAA